MKETKNQLKECSTIQVIPNIVFFLMHTWYLYRTNNNLITEQQNPAYYLVTLPIQAQKLIVFFLLLFSIYLVRSLSSFIPKNLQKKLIKSP